MTNIEILSRRDDFLHLAVEKLGKAHIDFCETLDFIRNPGEPGESWRAAGVLLPLFFRETPGNRGEFVFKLLKRSAAVAQSGDISCPGGMLDSRTDALLRPLIAAGFPPVLRGRAMDYARRRGALNWRSITLFLTNAVRESWEELRLSPFNVQFLGPLPCHPLLSFTRIIFPLAGYVRKDWKPRPNWEVEKIIELPLKDFFDESHYALYSIETTYKLRDNLSGIQHFPCFIAEDEKGEEEILWGATLSVVMSFLKAVFDFEIPELSGSRTLTKVLHADYLTGNGKR